MWFLGLLVQGWGLGGGTDCPFYLGLLYSKMNTRKKGSSRLGNVDVVQGLQG